MGAPFHMNPTEPGSAAVFFADLILPLRFANVRRGVNYLDRGPRRPSYWGEVISRTGGMECFSGSTCEAAALLGLLGDYWRRQNEPSLRQLLPHLEALRENLTRVERTDKKDEQPLTEFVYPLS